MASGQAGCRNLARDGLQRATQRNPASTIVWDTRYALNYNFDTDAPKIFATSGIYTESAMSFMSPPNPTQLDGVRNRGGKLLVIHGNSDPVFFVDDTTNWYQSLNASYGGNAAEFTRFFRVPGMGHSRGGPATDQFDALTALVNWVKKGEAPDSILTAARGAGNAGGVNAELTASWSATRTRPLCAYPKVARFKGTGDIESASSFHCQ